MPNIYEGGDEWPTPEETVAALLEQGVSAKQIILDAQEAIDVASTGIVWVDAIAGEHGDATTDRLKAHMLAEQALAAAERAGVDADTLKVARAAHGEAVLDVTIASANSTDARIAAFQHRQHAQETIDFAKRRIAAAKK